MEQTFDILCVIPVGQYQCSKWYEFWKRGGWLTVERSDGMTSIMWTSGKDTHHPFCGNAVSIDIDNKSRNIKAFYMSALSMWLRWGYGRGTDIEKSQGLFVANWMENYLRKYL